MNESDSVNSRGSSSTTSSPPPSSSQSAEVWRLSRDSSRVSLQVAEAQRQSNRLADGARAAQRELDNAVTQNRFAEISALTKQRDDAVRNFEEIRAQLQRLQSEQDARLQRLQNLERQVAEQQQQQQRRDDDRRVGERVEVYSNTAGAWLDAEVAAIDESTGAVSVNYTHAGVQFTKKLLPVEAQQSLRKPFERRAQSIRRDPVSDRPEEAAAALSPFASSNSSSAPSSNVPEAVWKREIERLRDLARIAKLEQEVRSLAGDGQASMFERLHKELQRQIFEAADVDAPNVGQLLELRARSDDSFASSNIGGGESPAVLTGAKSVEAWRAELNKLEKRLQQAEKMLQRRNTETPASAASDESVRELGRQKQVLETQLDRARRVALPSLSDFVALQQASRDFDHIPFADDTELQSRGMDSASDDGDEDVDTKPFYDDEGNPLGEKKPAGGLDPDDTESKVPSWKVSHYTPTGDARLSRSSPPWAISATLRMHLDPAAARATSDGVADLKQLIAQAAQIQQFLRNKQAAPRDSAVGPQEPLSNFVEEKTNLHSPADTNDTEHADLPDRSSFSRGRLGTVDEKAEPDGDCSSGDSDDEDATVEGHRTGSLGETVRTEEKVGAADGQQRGAISGSDLKVVVDWVPRTEEELARAVERREYGRAARLYALLQRLRFGRELPTDVETRDDGFVHSADDPWDYVYVNVNHGGRLGLGLRNSAQDNDDDDDDDDDTETGTMASKGATEKDTLNRLSVDFPVVITRVDEATDGFGVDGVLPGDRIVQVNGVDTKGASFEETLQMISSAARPLELTFLRFVGPSEDAPPNISAENDTGRDDSLSGGGMSPEPEQRSGPQQDSPPAGESFRPESPTSRVEKARAALRAARERLDDVQASGPEEFGEDSDAFARRLAGLRHLQQELLRELQAAEADLDRLSSEGEPSTTSQRSTSQNGKSSNDDNNADGIIDNNANQIDDLVEELQRLEESIQKAAAAGRFSDAYELGKSRSGLLRSLQKARERRDSTGGGGGDDDDNDDGDSGPRDQQRGATRLLNEERRDGTDATSLRPLPQHMSKRADETTNNMANAETSSNTKLHTFFESQLKSLDNQIANALDHGNEAFAAQLQAQQQDLQRQMAEEGEMRARVAESRALAESALEAKEESLNEVELQITSAIASGRFTDAVSLGKRRAQLQKEVDVLRKLKAGANGEDDVATSVSSSAATTSNSADTLEKEVTKLEDELKQMNLELTTAVASGNLSKAIQLSERRDGLQQRLRRAKTFANAARLATGGATTDHDDLENPSDAADVDAVNSARAIVQQLELELKAVEEGLANAVDRDQFARALLLTQRRDAVCDDLQRSQNRLRVAEQKFEEATAAGTGVDDAEDVEYYDDDGNVLEVATSPDARTENNNNASVVNPPVDDIAEETDPLVLRATAVNLETKLREKDLEILSAIDANDFDSARELNQSKHNLQNMLSRAKNRLEELQPHPESDARANGGENVEDTVARLQLELENVETQIASADAGDDPGSNTRASDSVALEQRRAVLRAELRELHHRAVARPASPTMGTIPEQDEDQDTSDEYNDGDSDFVVDAADASNNVNPKAQAERSSNQQNGTKPHAREATRRRQAMSKWVAIAAPLERELQSIERQLEGELPASDAAKLRTRREQLIQRLKREYQNAVMAGELSDDPTPPNTTVFTREHGGALPTTVEELRLRLRAIERDIARAVAANRPDEVHALKSRRDAIEGALASRMRERQNERLQHQLRVRAEDAADYQKAVRTDVGDKIALDLAARETGQQKTVAAAEQSKPPAPARSSGFSRNGRRHNNWSSGVKLSDSERSRIKAQGSAQLAGHEPESIELSRQRERKTRNDAPPDVVGDDDQGVQVQAFHGQPEVSSSQEDAGAMSEAVVGVNGARLPDLLSPMTQLSESEKVALMDRAQRREAGKQRVPTERNGEPHVRRDDAAMAEVKTDAHAGHWPSTSRASGGAAPRGQFNSQDYSSVFWGASATTTPKGEMWGRATRTARGSRDKTTDAVAARQALAHLKEKAAVLFLLRLKKSVLSQQDSVVETKQKLTDMVRNRPFALVDAAAASAGQLSAHSTSVQLDADSRLSEDTVRSLLQYKLAGGDPIAMLQESARSRREELVERASELEMEVAAQKEALRRWHDSTPTRTQEMLLRAKQAAHDIMDAAVTRKVQALQLKSAQLHKRNAMYEASLDEPADSTAQEQQGFFEGTAEQSQQALLKWPQQVAKVHSDLQAHRLALLQRVLDVVGGAPTGRGTGTGTSTSGGGGGGVGSVISTFKSIEFLRQLHNHRVHVLRSQGRGGAVGGQRFSPVLASPPKRERRPRHLQQLQQRHNSAKATELVDFRALQDSILIDRIDVGPDGHRYPVTSSAFRFSVASKDAAPMYQALREFSMRVLRLFVVSRAGPERTGRRSAVPSVALIHCKQRLEAKHHSTDCPQLVEYELYRDMYNELRHVRGQQEASVRAGNSNPSTKTQRTARRRRKAVAL